MATTRVPEIEAAIIEILDDVEGLTDVELSENLEPNSKEYVWIYESESASDFASLGRQPVIMHEDVKLQIRVFTAGGGPPADAKARAWELVGLVESALRENMTLNSTVEWQRIDNRKGQSVELDDRKGFHVLMTLLAHTKIQGK